MTKEELKAALASVFPEAMFDESSEWLAMQVNPGAWKEVAEKLRHGAGLDFDYLFCITGVDWKTHLSLVYHLSSTKHRQSLVIKSILDRNQPEIETVSDIWRTAEFHEREAYDLFGIRFKHHPDLRRLFLTEEWQGWPLRKDYEDPVNMIKL